MFEELLKQWANEQGFQTWSQDHAAVLRNLTTWLNGQAVEQSFAPDASLVTRDSAGVVTCKVCGTGLGFE